VGQAKTESAKRAALAINPHVTIETHPVRLDAGNALELIGRYDIVADGSDNFATRFPDQRCLLLRQKDSRLRRRQRIRRPACDLQGA
jgi:molybdopterin/thiamine biosynthesis adenylyltransferase